MVLIILVITVGISINFIVARITSIINIINSIIISISSITSSLSLSTSSPPSGTVSIHRPQAATVTRILTTIHNDHVSPHRTQHHLHAQP